MVEYARCIYMSWCENKTLEYIQTHEYEFLCICSRLLHYTHDELHTRLVNETWYLI